MLYREGGSRSNGRNKSKGGVRLKESKSPLIIKGEGEIQEREGGASSNRRGKSNWGELRGERLKEISASIENQRGR